MKKLFSGFLAACILSSCFTGMSTVSAAKSDAEEVNENVASVVFGTKKDTTSNIKSVKTVGSSSMTTVNGTAARRLDRIYGVINTTGHGRVLIDLDDAFFCGNTDGTEFLVTVKYVDMASGNFAIAYDGLHGMAFTETVYAGLTNGIKERTFTLTDANFKNGLEGGADIMLTFPEGKTRTARSAYITELKIEKIPAANPVMVTIEGTEAGNVHNYEMPVKMVSTFTNYSDVEQNFDVTYRVQNHLGNVESERTEKMTLAPREVKVVEDSPEHHTYGRFFYDVIIKGETESYTKSSQFSYINTAQDGLRNERMIYCDHPIGELGAQSAKFVNMANAAGIRSNYSWDYIEKSMGVFDLGDNIYKPKLDYLKAHNMKYIGVAGLGGAHGLGWPMLPESEDMVTAMVNYLSHCIDYMGPELSPIEIWNEPNLTSFAKNGSPKLYAWVATRAAEQLRERYPDLEIGALALCGMTASEETHHTVEFTQESIDQGVWENADAGTWHPYYSTSEPEGGRQVNAVMKLMQMIWDAGYTDKKIWNTEIGWTTARNSVSTFTSREQSAWHNRYFILWDEIPAMEYYCAYVLVNPGNMEDEREDKFGMMDSSDYPVSGIKFLADEAYVTLTNQSNILAGTNKPTKLDTGVANIFAYQYRNDKRDEDIIAFWKRLEEQKDTLHLNLGAKSVRFVDSYGNETVLESETGEYDVLPDYEVSYIIGDFGNVSITPSSMNFDEVNIDSISEDIVNIKIHGIENADSYEIREQGFATILGDNKIVNGEADIRLQLPELRNDLSSLYILLKKDGKTTSAVKVYLVKSDLFDASLNASLTTHDYTAWNGYLTIKNNSQRRAIEGYAKITEINGEKVDYKDTYTGPVAAGTQSLVKVSMPKVYERNLKDVKYQIMFKDGSIFEYTQTLNFAFAPYAKQKPTIDGIWSDGEWEDNTSFYANDKSQVKLIPDWAGKDDLSAEIKTAWDYDNFYITAKVKDNVFHQEETGEFIWRGDSIQFGLMYGKETYVAYGNFGTKYTELGAAKTPEGDQVYRWMSEDEVKPKGMVEEYECVIVRDEATKTTTYEIALPWSQIMPQNIESFDPNGRALGFSMLFNDNDKTGRRGWIEFASGIGEGKDSSLFTYLNLINVE